MPYRLTQPDPDRPRWLLTATAHNALTPRGFVIAVGLAAAMMALPLLALLGSRPLWVFLPFALLPPLALWYAIHRNWAARAVREELELSPEGLRLTHRSATGEVIEWRAHPAWAALHRAPHSGPVQEYLTLTGGGREVELGAFLTPAERLRLEDELSMVLAKLKARS